MCHFWHCLLRSEHLRRNPGRHCAYGWDSRRYLGNHFEVEDFQDQEGGSRTQELLTALKACSSARDLDIARAIHARALHTGHFGNVYVANTAVDMFASCGSLAEARGVFDRMPCHSVVSWNALILGYAQHGVKEAALALDLFRGMEAEPDRRTFVAALKACSTLAASSESSKLGALEIGMATHSQAIKAGCDAFNYVANTMVDMYANCGSMADARKVFDRMESWDVVSWNALLLGYAENEEELALRVFSCMASIEDAPQNHLTFVAAIKACTNLAPKEKGRKVDGRLLKVAALERASDLHAQATASGHERNAKVAGALVDMYAKCGSMVAARRVFEKFSPLDVALWNILMLGYADNKEAELALEVFESMKAQGFTPNSRTFVAVLKACTSLAAKEEGRSLNGKVVKLACLEKGVAIHRQALELGCDGDIYLASTLVDLYAKCGSLTDARKVFDAMLRRNEVSWNALIQGYVESNEAEGALALFSEMRTSTCAPDALSFVAAIKACTALGAEELGKQQPDGKLVKVVSLEKGRAVHDQARNSGWDANTFVRNSLVDMYAKCGSLEDARRLLDGIPGCDAVSKTALMQGYAESGDGELALEIFWAMESRDALAFAAALKACGSIAALEPGRRIHAEACRVDFGRDSLVPNGVVDFYAKCGSMDAAQHAFDSLQSRDSVNFTALIAGYSHQGDSSAVFDLFHAMEDEGCDANAVTFVSLLTACSRAGLVRNGQSYFSAMAAKFGVRPGLEHYVCMVDMLARSNHLSQALAMVEGMPFQPNTVLWTSVLAACWKWKNVEVGKVAFDALVRLDENESAAYLLMANIYGSCGLWEERARVLEAATGKQVPRLCQEFGSN
ncbi:pentatricopeptide repeat-containing protein At3g09040, mitochondrial-like [Selaginella moellendorffii]|uniref:pentatricopeptide repeat-containing protein At3g09040, mitochondrial-like n=1 Tax=Selaginella moellendorffii TaxID=88036 RepID=UPI000D1CC327|nr:pentatricopeptide repeat-containing protein At3g09040, mitochondrial-like [Selaginella moellendorffii]|eukprot:XP_024529758.1 pentatricopeptide repeat-containing protein At3g09040, mitochondrial-like [Selaginella moellendorffii]